jgi:hypothetical protein
MRGDCDALFPMVALGGSIFAVFGQCGFEGLDLFNTDNRTA